VITICANTYQLSSIEIVMDNAGQAMWTWKVAQAIAALKVLAVSLIGDKIFT
jgi:hypothetical protein